MQKVKIGVIGLGEIAQVTHIPTLKRLDDKYEIIAGCDVSEKLREKICEEYNIPQQYADYHELIEKSGVDAVLVLTKDHTDVVLTALAHDKYVLVEKPMCLTLSDADKIIEANKKSKGEVVVGYMRCYAPAFEMAVKEVGGIENIRYVKLRDIIGGNNYFVRQANKVYKFDDMPESIAEINKQRDNEICLEVHGTTDVDPQIKRMYNFLNGLSTHDISAMREIIGRPQKVESAVTWGDAPSINVVFKYDKFYAAYETVALTGYGRFDASIEVFGDGKTVSVYYDTPYISNLPVKLVVTETKDDVFEERIIRPTYLNPFDFELAHFHEVITTGIRPKTTPEDAKEDLLIFADILKYVKEHR